VIDRARAAKGIESPIVIRPTTTTAPARTGGAPALALLPLAATACAKRAAAQAPNVTPPFESWLASQGDDVALGWPMPA